MNIVIVSHKHLTQPDDDLAEYLRKRPKYEVLHIRHSFSEAKDRSSYYSLYRDGRLMKEEVTGEFNILRFFEPFLYVKEAIFTLVWIIYSRKQWDVYIGMDGLCVIFGVFLKRMGFVKKVVFWAIDFVPKDRFSEGYKNKIYKVVNKFSYKRADEVWDLSPRMIVAREQFLGIERDSYKKHRVVPYGVWLKKIKQLPLKEKDKNTLVFMGHLLPKQGVQLIIESMPKILQSLPGFKFKIIGDGYYKNTLMTLAKQLGVYDSCIFMGKIGHEKYYSKLIPEIASSACAVALYVSALDKWTYYADSGKIKTYLACGVPVLMTDLPWNAQEIEKNGCGIIVEENSEQIVRGIIDLMNKDNNKVYRENARKYAQNFDYSSIFENLGLVV